MMFTACSDPAPHLNPLDPGSAKFDRGSAIAGTVTTIYQPFSPIENAEVRLTPGLSVQMTDAEGRFRFDNLEPKTYILEFSREGYAPSLITLPLEERQVAAPVVTLNALPSFVSVSLTTEHIAQLPPTPDRFFLNVLATANDPDGATDIARIWLEIEGIGFVDTLERTESPGIWSEIYSTEDFSVNHLERLAGLPFLLQAVDFPGSQVRNDPLFIARIIEETPQILSPAGNTATGNAPLFRWQKPALAFEFSQQIEIFRVDALGVARRLAVFSAISSAVSRFQFIGRLSAGDYLWRISIIDAFGNASRSPEAAFRVE